MTKESLVKAPATRVRRNPVEGRNKLRVKGEKPGFVYRIVNDRDDNIHDFLERGWEIDTDEDIRVGDSRVDQDSRLGKVRMISVGGGMKAVLMRIRQDWYDEDQAAKQEYVDKSEQAMRPNPNEGTYGKVDITRKTGV
jgi:hypothetical protein